METFNAQVSFYNKRFAFSEEKFIDENPNDSLKVAVVIPAYNEDIEGFISELQKLDCKRPNEIELIVVLNHSIIEADKIKEIHQSQFQKFNNYKLSSGIFLRFIPAFDLKTKHAGVGLARKIGMDEALKRFQEINYPGLIVCLDADCKVAPNYFDSLLNADSKGFSGLSLYYEHPLSELNSNDQDSILNYEIFLRYYSLGLKSAGYPHYYQTVGSSMACRSDLYSKIGGMNRRKAGEDFYFLHKVFPHANFRVWTETTIFPSARKSTRVPFGTGKAMIAMDEGLKDYSLLFHPEIFKELSIFLADLSLIFHDLNSNLSSIVLDFLKTENLLDDLKALISRSASLKAFETNFYYWFDGFKVMKYLHYCQANHFLDLQNMEACKELLGTKALDNKALLFELRALEKQG